MHALPKFWVTHLCVLEQTHEPPQDQRRRTSDTDFAVSLVVWSHFDSLVIVEPQKTVERCKYFGSLALRSGFNVLSSAATDKRHGRIAGLQQKIHLFSFVQTKLKQDFKLFSHNYPWLRLYSLVATFMFLFFFFFDDDDVTQSSLHIRSPTYFSTPELTRPSKLECGDLHKAASRWLTPRSPPELRCCCLSLPLLSCPVKSSLPPSLTAGSCRLP